MKRTNAILVLACGLAVFLYFWWPRAQVTPASDVRQENSAPVTRDLNTGAAKPAKVASEAPFAAQPMPFAGPSKTEPEARMSGTGMIAVNQGVATNARTRGPNPGDEKLGSIPVRNRAKTLYRIIRDPKEVARTLEIIWDARDVMGPGGSLYFKGNYTHWLYLPELWTYNSATGDLQLFSKDAQPVYRIPPQDKDEFDTLLEARPDLEANSARAEAATLLITQIRGELDAYDRGERVPDSFDATLGANLARLEGLSKDKTGELHRLSLDFWLLPPVVGFGEDHTVAQRRDRIRQVRAVLNALEKK